MYHHASYDVVDRIAIGTLCSAMVSCVRQRARSSIQQYLVEAGITGKGKNITYFNYGRNALYTLFQERFAGKIILFPSFICPSLVLAAVKAGVKPHFVDVNLEDFNLDINLVSDEDLESADALFVNHTFGVPADIEKIRTKIKAHGTYLIEDIAQALFARYKEEYVGTLGDTVLLSMYKQTPNLNGAVLLSDLAVSEPRKGAVSLDDFVRMLWLTSGPHDYLLKVIRQRKGLPEGSDELQKGKALCQPSRLSLSLFATLLPSLKDLVDRKRTIAKHYQRRAETSTYFIPQQINEAKEPARFNFSVRLLPEIARIRDALLLALRRKGIFCDRLWHDSPVALNAFKDYLKGDYPNARLLAKSVINLPIKADYQERDVDYLFDSVEQIVQELI